MDITFFKVIHNKYLFNIILGYIPTINNEYTNIEKWFVGNKKKFKDIKSLRWMVKNKQLELLKSKLEMNEYIHVNQKSFERLIEFCSSGSGITSEHDNNNLFQLFYGKCKIQIEQMYKMEPGFFEKVITKYNHLESTRLFIQDGRVSKTSGQFLLKCLNYTSLHIIKLAFENSNTNTINGINNQILKYSSLNLKYKQEVIEWWLFEMNGAKQIENIEYEFKIGFYDFISIGPIKIQKLLLKMDLVKKYTLPICYFKKNVNNLFTMGIDELKLHIKILYKVVVKSDGDDLLAPIKELIKKACSSTNPKKKLQKLIIKATGFDDFIYNEYLKIYDEIIKVDHLEANAGIESIFRHGLISWSDNSYNYMINHLNNGNDAPKSSFYFTFDQLKINNPNGIDEQIFKKMISFIKLIIEKKCQYLDKLEMIHWVILNCHSLDLLNQLVKINGLPANSCKVSRLTDLNWSTEKLQWYYNNFVVFTSNNQTDLQMFTDACINSAKELSSKEIIDFILDYVIKVNTKQRKLIVNTNLKIGSIELADYVFIEKFNSNGPIQQIYFNSFYKSVCSSDLETLNKFIEKKFKFTTVNFKDNNHFKFGQLDNQQINQVLIVLNDSGFLNFNNKLFINLLDSLIKCQEFTFSNSSSLVFTNDFSLSIGELLTGYINCYQLKAIEKLLSIDGVVDTLISSKGLSKMYGMEYDNNTFTKYYIYDSNKLPCKTDISSTLIESLIVLLFKYFGNNIVIVYVHLFKVLLQCKDVTFQIVNSIRELFKLNSIDFDMEETFHLFNYLGIRSLKHLKFIMGKNEILEILELHQTKYYDCHKPYNRHPSNNFKISDYLNSTFFTFDQIFSLDNEKLFYLLRNQFSILPVNKRSLYNTSEKLNWYKQNNDAQDLKYLLKIGDLNLIKSFLCSTHSSLTYYFTIYVSNEFTILIGSNIDYLKIILNELSKVAGGDPIHFIKTLLKSSFEQSNLPIIKFILSNYQSSFTIIPYSLNQLIIKNHLDILNYINENKLILEK